MSEKRILATGFVQKRPMPQIFVTEAEKDRHEINF